MKPLRWCGAALLLLALAAIAHCWFVFSQVVDEPAHIAAGLEWLDRGEYTLDIQHPPLARIADAIGPLLRGARYQPRGHWMPTGNAILYGNDAYSPTLASARAGTLPFFLLGCVVVAMWAAKLVPERRELAAVIALLFFATQPTVLGHATVATTDAAVAMLIAAALLAFVVALERPSIRAGAIFGVAAAAAIATKFSALAFLPAGILVILLFRWRDARREHLGAVAVATIVGATCLLAVYRFNPSLLIDGIAEVAKHNRGGHVAYLFGRWCNDGWWYYFPVALWFKSTLAVLIAFAIGARRFALPAAISAAILAVAMASSINVGIRHVLAIYPFLAIVAGCAVALMPRVPAAILVAAQLVSFGLAHPDHLAYFNFTAGREPAHILLDSNLDWGQDLLRLEDAVARRHIDSLAIAYFGSANPTQHRLPNPRLLRPFEPTTGWIAISEMRLRRGRGFEWLLRYEPVERVGKSIRLYFVPAARPR